jgi:hypothetical protein
MNAWRLLLLLVVPAACGTFKPRAMADGSYRLQCAATLAQCEKRARQWCGDDEFILVQRSDPEVYGVQGHKTGTEGALVVFRCGAPSEEPEWKLPARRDASTAEAPASARPAPSASARSGAPEPPPARPERVCTPGVTQRCHGPGACDGAQACLPDGSGFGPCDCGSDTPDPDAEPDGAADAG